MKPLSSNLPWDMAANIWANSLNPLLAAPLSSMSIIQNVVLINGATTIPHKIGRLQLGWFILDQNAAANIYRSAPLNASNLTLTSDAIVTVSLGVF